MKRRNSTEHGLISPSKRRMPSGKIVSYDTSKRSGYLENDDDDERKVYSRDAASKSKHSRRDHQCAENKPCNKSRSQKRKEYSCEGGSESHHNSRRAGPKSGKNKSLQRTGKTRGRPHTHGEKKRQPITYHHGRIHKVGRYGGNIHASQKLPSEYWGHVVTFEHASVMAGRLKLVPGDKVDFMLGVRDIRHPHALRVNLVEPVQRSTEEWQRYLEEICNDIGLEIPADPTGQRHVEIQQEYDAQKDCSTHAENRSNTSVDSHVNQSVSDKTNHAIPDGDILPAESELNQPEIDDTDIKRVSDVSLHDMTNSSDGSHVAMDTCGPSSDPFDNESCGAVTEEVGVNTSDDECNGQDCAMTEQRHKDKILTSGQVKTDDNAPAEALASTENTYMGNGKIVISDNPIGATSGTDEIMSGSSNECYCANTDGNESSKVSEYTDMSLAELDEKHLRLLSKLDMMESGDEEGTEDATTSMIASGAISEKCVEPVRNNPTQQDNPTGDIQRGSDNISAQQFKDSGLNTITPFGDTTDEEGHTEKHRSESTQPMFEKRHAQELKSRSLAEGSKCSPSDEPSTPDRPPKICDPGDILQSALSSPIWRQVGKCEVSNKGIMLLLYLFHHINVSWPNMHNHLKECLQSIFSGQLFRSKFSGFYRYVSQSYKVEAEMITNFLVLVSQHIPEQLGVILPAVECMVHKKANSFERSLFSSLKTVARLIPKSYDNVEWSEMKIFPSFDEMKGTSDCWSGLHPVRDVGKYFSAEDYFDTYFRLLREDCFESIQSTIQNYVRGHQDTDWTKIWTEVTFMGLYVPDSPHNAHTGFLFEMDHKQNTTKSFMFGNLVCVSPNGMFDKDNIIWTTVYSNKNVLQRSLVTLELCDNENNENQASLISKLRECGNAIVLIESTTYYKAYQPVLKALQNISPEDVALKETLVFSQKQGFPSYVPHKKYFGLWEPCLWKGAESPTAPNCVPPASSTLNPASPVSSESCPKSRDMQGLERYSLPVDFSFEELGDWSCLDESQREAIKHAMTHDLALIQGPPGTGKSFIAEKIVQLLLMQNHPWAGPILVLTHKNCALDEFLENLLRHVNEHQMARVGGGSDNDVIKKLTLHNSRLVQNDKPFERRRNIQVLRDEVRQANIDVREAFKNLELSRRFDSRIMMTYLTKSQIASLLPSCSPAEIDDLHESIKSSPDLCADLRCALVSWLPKQETLEQCATELIDANVILGSLATTQHTGSMHRNAGQDTLEDFDKEYQERCLLECTFTNENDFEFIEVNKEMGRYLSPEVKATFRNKSDRAIKLVTDMWSLSQKERAKFVFQIMSKHCDLMENKLQRALDTQRLTNKLKSAQDIMLDYDILSAKKIIGMTITGASIYHNLLKQLRPQVVIVEEAAETLEPQLIAAIGDWTKHLILIGDHEQLRPSVDSHRIAKEYKLDVSMMERLISNNLPSVRLSTQNRMRPEFAKLLDDIYPQLKTNRQRVRKKATCMVQSMYFWDCEAMESKIGNSHQNEEEAERAVLLALYLISNGYGAQSITLLAAYSGQVQYMKHLISDLPANQKQTVEGMSISSIDRYQGSENDFVIVSLVRSNTEGNIGYMKERARRCVAQSRSRRGLYFIGNVDTFSSSRHWRVLLRNMKSKGCVGKAIPLCCKYHKTSIRYVSTFSKDYTFVECEEPCVRHFECGHECPKPCKPDHDHLHCEENIVWTCPKCDHESAILCKERNQPCMEYVEFTFPDCEHVAMTRCSDGSPKCDFPCNRTLPCGHLCEKLCYNKCSTSDCCQCRKIRREEVKKRKKLEQKLREEENQRITEEIENIRAGSSTREYWEITREGDDVTEYFTVQQKTKTFFTNENVDPALLKVLKVVDDTQELKLLEQQIELGKPVLSVMCTRIGTSLDAMEDILNHGFKDEDFEEQELGFTLSSHKKREIIDPRVILVLCDIIPGRTKETSEQKTTAWLKEKRYNCLLRTDGNAETGEQVFFPVTCDQVAIRHIVSVELRESPNAMLILENEALASGKNTSHTLQPSRTYDQNDSSDCHFRMAESQFLRLLGKRKLRVTSVDYYLTPSLIDKFRAKQKEFATKHGPTDSKGYSQAVPAFHGTLCHNVKQIMTENFSLDKTRRGLYGRGIYFSEFPEISLDYGKGLIMCMILPGKSFDCLGTMNDADCELGYDSHRVKADKDGRGKMIVIFNPDQILPMYDIHYSD